MITSGLVAFLIGVTSVAQAATVVWDGGHASKDAWSAKNNWNPNGAPPSNGTADLRFTGSVRLTPDADGAWSVNSISFDSGAGAFAIGGGAVTLQGTSVAYAVANNSSKVQTFGNALVVGANQTWNANTADLGFTGPIDLGTHTLTLTGSASTSASGVISGAGALAKQGAGTLALSGANTYSGATTITTGALRVQHNNALGSTAGATTVAGRGAALELDSSVNGNLTVAAEPLYLNGTGVSGNGALRNVAGSNTFAGVVTLVSPSSISNSAAGTTLTLSGGTNSLSQALTVTGTGNTTISANMTNGTGTLTKEGTGTLTFSGFTGIVGQTNLSVGTMVVGNGGTTNLNTAEFSSATSTTLLVASGGTVNAVYGNGNTYFNGIFDAASAGTFAVTSLAGTSSGLTFGASFTATNLTLNLGGSSIGGSDLSNYFRLELAGVNISVGTLHLTGDTILDFNGANATFLSSTNLIIDANVKIIVEGWMSAANDLAHSTVWYANGTINGGTLVGGDQIGGIPLNQITFTGYSPAMATGWIDGNHGGWFDREVRPTPEPTTYGAIMIGAALGFLGYRRFIRLNVAPAN